MIYIMLYHIYTWFANLWTVCAYPLNFCIYLYELICTGFIQFEKKNIYIYINWMVRNTLMKYRSKLEFSGILHKSVYCFVRVIFFSQVTQSFYSPLRKFHNSVMLNTEII